MYITPQIEVIEVETEGGVMALSMEDGDSMFPALLGKTDGVSSVPVIMEDLTNDILNS